MPRGVAWSLRYSPGMDPLHALADRAAAPTRWVIGLMSGMSLDGLDVALARVEDGDGVRPSVELVAARTFPYGIERIERLRAAASADVGEIAALDAELAALWGEHVLHFLREVDVEPGQILAIGSHGQTVFHTPRGRSTNAVTLQIGQGDVLAHVTGLPVVCDFRPRDIAAGGEGAPLIPLVDWILAGEGAAPLAMHNLGSIANVTICTPCLDDVVAFDTGPANTLIDAAVRSDPAGEVVGGFDRDGTLSAAGEVDEDLILQLYMARSAWMAEVPPKSAGYETFGPPLWRAHEAHWRDLPHATRVRTAVEYTALVLRDAYAWHVLTRFPGCERVRFSGGGCHNPTLMARIRSLLADLEVEVEVFPSAWIDAKEAVGFALLADRRLRGEPTNVPGATGASACVSSGAIHLP